MEIVTMTRGYPIIQQISWYFGFRERTMQTITPEITHPPSIMQTTTMAPTPTNHHIIDGSPLDPKLLDGVGVCEIAAVRVGEYDTATDSVDDVEKEKDGDAVADSDRVGVKDGDGVEPTK